jgi:hypothetical protein
MAVSDDPKVKAVAEAASAKASDFGARAFAEHTAYGQAITSNEAAQKAWNTARIEAHALTLLSPVFAAQTDIDEQGRTLEQDATDRIEELQVARKALFDDMAAHAVIVVKESPSSFPGLAGLPQTTDELLQRLQPDFSTWTSEDYIKSAAFGGAGGLVGYFAMKRALGAVLGGAAGLALSLVLKG